jgi:hypothetical protein
MDVLREKLREFYQKQYAEQLSVRKTASNYLLVEKKGGKKAILAKFSIAGLGEHAWDMADHAKSTLANEMAEEEMKKLVPAEEVKPKPISEYLRAVGRASRPMTEHAKVYECVKVAENPLNQFVPDLFDRTASSEKPLE